MAAQGRKGEGNNHEPNIHKTQSQVSRNETIKKAQKNRRRLRSFRTSHVRRER